MKNINTIKLCGIITESPQPLSETEGRYYHTYVTVRRDSGTEDTLQLIMHRGASRRLHKGDTVMIHGKICTRNQDGHLIMGCKAKYISRVDSKVAHCNIVELDGHICADPYYRNLGTREITNITVANNSRNHSYYIPVIVWGYDARDVSDMSVGEYIHIKGRLQSRKYLDSNLDEHTTYEVSTINLMV